MKNINDHFEAMETLPRQPRPKARLVRVERARGLNTVNNIPHGLAWCPVWEVVVEFYDHAQAKEFFDSLHEGGGP